jgi:hypothetical protein
MGKLTGRPNGRPVAVGSGAKPPVIKGSKPLQVLVRAMHYYEDQANGYLGVLARFKLPEPDEMPAEGSKEAEALKDKIKTVTECAASLKEAFDTATDYAAKAANFIHPRLSSVQYGAMLDYTRLSADELRIFIPLFKKCLVGRATQQDSEQGGEGDAGPNAGGNGEASPATQH